MTVYLVLIYYDEQTLIHGVFATAEAANRAQGNLSYLSGSETDVVPFEVRD